MGDQDQRDESSRNGGAGGSSSAIAMEVDRLLDRDQPKQSYAALRKQYEVDNTGFESESMNGSFGSVRGGHPLEITGPVLMDVQDMFGVRPPVQVTDARAHGANRSFNDEVDALVSSIEDPSAGAGLRRLR